MSIQCTKCFASYEQAPPVCLACPCHADPEDAKRKIKSPIVDKAGRPIVSKATGTVLKREMTIYCQKRCRNTVFREFKNTAKASAPITIAQHYNVEDTTPEMIGKIWLEGYASVGTSNEIGETRFFRLKVRVSEDRSTVKVYDRKAKTWEIRNAKSCGFNLDKAMSKGNWLKVATL